MLTDLPRGRFVAVLGALFGLLVIVSAIEPFDRSAWLLENALVVAAVGFLAATYRRMPLSRISYGLIFIFLCLHETGAH